MRWRAVILGAVILLTAACSSGEKAGPTATVGTAAPTTATTDPYAVPPAIDEAYVNRILAGLDQSIGDVTRLVRATRAVPREAMDRLRALYEGELLQLKIDGIQRNIREDFKNARDNPGNQRTAVVNLLTASSDCIFTEVNRDYSAVSTNPAPELSHLWVGLRRSPENVQIQYNPTGWILVYDGFPQDQSMPTNPCE